MDRTRTELESAALASFHCAPDASSGAAEDASIQSDHSVCSSSCACVTVRAIPVLGAGAGATSGEPHRVFRRRAATFGGSTFSRL